MAKLSRQSEFVTFREFCQKQGLLEPSLAARFVSLAMAIGLFLVGATLHWSHPWLAIGLASCGGITLVWWIHNAGHDAFFESKHSTKAIIETLGILFLGMPQIEYHYEIHRRHHGFTNVIGKDGALDTGPVIWHEKMLSGERSGPIPFQAELWFFVILPMTWPLINFRCIQILFSRKSYARLAGLALRWTVLPYLLGYDWAFLMIPILVTGFVLGFSASLNHFHMAMDDQPVAPFPENIFLTTQNLSHRGWFATWLTGGLNFHVEHHLFPNVPSANLRKLAPLVEEFARQNALPYQVCNGAEAIGKLRRRLRRPQTSRIASLTSDGAST